MEFKFSEAVGEESLRVWRTENFTSADFQEFLFRICIYSFACGAFKGIRKKTRIGKNLFYFLATRNCLFYLEKGNMYCYV